MHRLLRRGCRYDQRWCDVYTCVDIPCPDEQNHEALTIVVFVVYVVLAPLSSLCLVLVAPHAGADKGRVTSPLRPTLHSHMDKENEGPEVHYASVNSLSRDFQVGAGSAFWMLLPASSFFF